MAAPKETIKKQTLADPRNFQSRALAIANRVFQGYGKEPARRWDDSPEKRAVQRKQAAAKRAAR